ncbi:hypothetical protein FOA52_002105 [Chlamydomonas sp. UWO 241]|nr:hypothetical protein FOA52_002105 [Chlamydomonas sp. UWO 241]
MGANTSTSSQQHEEEEQESSQEGGGRKRRRGGSVGGERQDELPHTAAQPQCMDALLDDQRHARMVVCASRTVPGLTHVTGFLDAREQAQLRARLESEIDARGGGSNQAMRFGDLPEWANQLADRVADAAVRMGLLPPELLARTPLFDQTIINLYRPGEGITPHVDLERFCDGIVSVSVGDPAVMCLTHVHDADAPEQQVLLRGGDLLVLHSQARHDWTHGIAAVASEVYSGDMPPAAGATTCATDARVPAILASASCPVHQHAGHQHAGHQDASLTADADCDAPVQPGAGEDPDGGAGEGAAVRVWSLLGLPVGEGGGASSVAEAGVLPVGSCMGTAAEARKQPASVGPQAEPSARGGLLVVRGTRLSVTLRRLKSGIVLTEQG